MHHLTSNREYLSMNNINLVHLMPGPSFPLPRLYISLPDLPISLALPLFAHACISPVVADR